jgi:2-polyprenyl-3-methyl-5-hydroxy-6-metoxy-1,4-benzoquinol methylase
MSTQANFRLEAHPEFGFLQIKPTPRPEEISAFYAQEFYASGNPRFNDSALEVKREDQEFNEAQWEAISVRICELLARPLSELSILDVGCGWAQALHYFHRKGASCYGFDPAPEAAEYGRSQGLNVVTAGMETMDVFEGKKFDVVTLFNVLEHLADPVAVLTEIRTRVLKPGGLLIIDVPNEFNAFQTCAREVHNLSEWWVAPPAHLNYFSRDSLVQLLEGTDYQVKLTEASFPLEMFLLFGDNYVNDRVLGKQCHQRRVAFELNLRKNGYGQVLEKFYQSLAELNLGRQVLAYAISA